MKEARIRALIQYVAKIDTDDSYIEMKEARIRALIQCATGVSSFLVLIEMKEARIRALIHFLGWRPRFLIRHRNEGSPYKGIDTQYAYN